MNFLPIGSNYVASISALNSMGTESTPASLTFTIGDKPIKTNDLQDGTVTTVTLADSTGTGDGVTSTKLADDAVTTIKIAADAVTAAKIQANTITASEIAAATITASQIAANTLTSASGVFGSISANDITAGTLSASRIAANSLSIAGIAVSGTAGNIGVGTGSKTNGTINDNVISFYYGQSTSLTSFFNSSPFRTNGTYTLFQLASKTFTTPAYSGTKPYACMVMGNPVGFSGGDEESIAVLEVKTSSGTIKSETAFVR